MSLIKKLNKKKQGKITKIKYNETINNSIQESMAWNKLKKSYQEVKMDVTFINEEIVRASQFENVTQKTLEASKKKENDNKYMHHFMYRDGETDAEYEEEYDDYADGEIVPILATDDEVLIGVQKKKYKKIEVEKKEIDDVLQVSGEIIIN